MRDACGLFGVWGDAEAALKTFYGLFALQHRGQESAGIASTNGRTVERHRGMGTVAAVFQDEDVLTGLTNPRAMGHVRYSTMGGSLLQNAQPLVVGTQWGTFAVGHNGNLVNAPALRARFEATGSIFQTTSDSEVILHLLARPGGSADPVQRVAEACQALEGAFSLLVMTPDLLIGVRDPHGFRPLWLGRAASGAWAFASETPAFDVTRITPVRELSPGTLVVVEEGREPREVRFAEPTPAHCVFEHVYFARPDGVLFGDGVQGVRSRLGRALAREHPVDADVVVAIPDSGNAAALGYSLESGIPLDHGFIRNHYIGRTFIQPSATGRQLATDMKLNVVKEVVQGKRVVVVDDSVVRGTTARRRCRFLRDAGAREVHLRVSCPPVRHPCFYGIDFQSKGELIAAQHPVDEIGRIVEVDTIGFLSVEGMLGAMGRPPSSYCTACWTGRYPVPIPEGMSKKSCGEAPPL